MERILVKYPALIFAGLYGLVRLFFYFQGYDDSVYKYLVSLNLLFIVLVISATLLRNYRQGVPPYFPSEIKAVMRSVSWYSVLIAAFIFVFYKGVDVDFFDLKMAQYKENLEATNYDILPDTENPLKVLDLSKEDFVEKEMEKLKTFNTPFAWTTLTLIGILITGLIYGLILVWLRLKILPLLFRK